MKAIFLLLIILSPVMVFAQLYKKHRLQEDRLSIELAEGVLDIIPLSDKAIRVQWEKNGIKEQREFVLVNKLPIPRFTFIETPSQLKLATRSVTVLFDKKSGAIDFSDNTGKLFLSEKTGSRKLVPDTIGGQPCFIAE